MKIAFCMYVIADQNFVIEYSAKVVYLSDNLLPGQN